MSTLKQEKYYTYEDWLALDGEERWELLDGAIYLMPAPDRSHQDISGEMFRQFANFLVDKPCRVYHAPFAVRLYKKKDTAFEPDIVVVCDPAKFTKEGCEGAPDLVVEILSPSTSRYDKLIKFIEYLRAGVREYWIVDPIDKAVTVYRLKDGFYVADVYADTDTAPVAVLPGCVVELPRVFAE